MKKKIYNPFVFSFEFLEITCPRPVVKYGRIISGFGPIYTYKQSIVFDCDKGYRLKGNKLIHCGADNSWYPPPPICELSKYGP